MTAKSVLFVAPPQTITPFFPDLKKAGFEVGLAENLSGALSFIQKSGPGVIFSKSRLPGYKVEKMLAASSEAMGKFPPIIVFTDMGTADEAKKLLELGARDYWLEPLDWGRLTAVLQMNGDGHGDSNDDGESYAAVPPTPPAQAEMPQSATPVSQAVASNATPRTKRAPAVTGPVEIIGKHTAVLRVLALAKQVAKSKATVLISGESGTGKEKFARYLHAHSDRIDKPFVAINCAALPEHLLESELFGHEKGSFTGAITRKLGKFELASGGTILLDEISEMDIGLQAKLLRVLQENEIDRVGGTETVKVDVRVLATTNRLLESYVEEGKFRQDLYYRLNVIPLKLPALKERGEDVLLLAAYFMNNFCRAYGLGNLEFSPDARQWLLDYDWPGNVRELQNLMERAVLLAGDGPVEKRHFLLDGEWEPDAESEEAIAQEAEQAGSDAFSGKVIPISEMERHLILKSLDQTEGNRTQAAQLLGISVRTLRNKLNEYKKQGHPIP